MFRASLCPSSGTQELYRWLLPVVLGALVMCSANRTHNPQLHTRPTTCKPKRQVPQAATICITLELLIMGVMVPETCWTNNKFCNKETNLLHQVSLLISTYYARQITFFYEFSALHVRVQLHTLQCALSVRLRPYSVLGGNKSGGDAFATCCLACQKVAVYCWLHVPVWRGENTPRSFTCFRLSI